ESGGFYSAEDAGEVGREGEFYVWSYEQLRALLDDQELALVSEYFDVNEDGGFEGNNILHIPIEKDWNRTVEADMQAIRAKLFAARSERARPHRDEKILTSWNALMISALCKGYAVLDDIRYLEAAQQAAGMIKLEMYQHPELKHSFSAGRAKVSGLLEDYAYLVQAAL
ncbi:MAG: thioredoxin domain-containing protein, partial [Bacteroidetes bacterium]|nr:thioredoxin domain-containing protein [Bacteroidota bacterium]